MKKLLTLLLVVIAAVSTAFAFSACDLDSLFMANDGNNATDNDNTPSSGDNTANDNTPSSSNNGSNSNGNSSQGGNSNSSDNTNSNGNSSSNSNSNSDNNAAHTCVFVFSSTVSPDCINEGYDVYACTCGKTENRNIQKALEHDYKYTTHSATCTTDWWQEGVCTRCGDKTTDTVPDSKRHSYGEYKSNDDATCAKDGTKTAICNDCGAENTVADEGTATGKHAYGEYKSNGDATCAKDGTKTAICGGCGARDTVTDTGTATGLHNYVSGVCVCGALKHAGELDYKLNDKGTEYAVVGLGTVTSKNVVIPATYNGKPVTEIGYGAFEECDITEITVPESIKKISFAFYKCDNLNRVNYTGTVNGWASIETWIAPSGHILFNAHSLYINGQHVTEVVVDNIDYFGGGFECSDIVSVKVGSGVKNLCGYAFMYCGELVSAEIADGVEIDHSLGSLFEDCGKLTSVKLPSNNRIISMHMFAYCESLKQINLPEATTHIDDGAFYLSGLTSIIIPKNVVRIGAFAFTYCDNLKSVTFADPSNWKSHTYIMDWDLVELFPENGTTKSVKYYMPLKIDFDLSNAKTASAYFSDLAKVFSDKNYENYNGLSLRVDCWDLEVNPGGGVVSTESYYVEVDEKSFHITVDEKDYYFMISFSLCKTDANDDIYYDSGNACGWASGGIKPTGDMW